MRSLDDTGFQYTAFYITDDHNVKEYFDKYFPNVRALNVDSATHSRLLEQEAPPINEYLYLLSQKDENGDSADICGFINLHSIGRTGSHLVSAVNQLTDSTADIVFSSKSKGYFVEGYAKK